MRWVALSAILLLGGANLADAGGARRVVKHASARRQHVYWAQYQSATELMVLAIPAVLEVGDEFDIVDSRGFFARVRMKTAEDVDQGCKQVSFRRGMASYLTQPTREMLSDAVAIGPSPREQRRAVVVMAGDAGDLPAVPQQLVQRTAVDADGDGAPDLIRDYWECADPQAQAQGRWAYCFTTWGRARRGARWSAVESTTLMNCY